MSLRTNICLPLIIKEFVKMILFICPSFDMCVFAELMSNQKLQNLLYMVLVAGNFLNSVSKRFGDDLCQS